MRELVGEFGQHLDIIGRSLDVEVSQRGGQVLLDGSAPAVDVADRVLQALYQSARSGRAVRSRDVHDAVRILSDDPTAELRTFHDDVILSGLDRQPIGPRSAGQRTYLHALRTSAVAFGVGPAGTGKTYVAVAVAVAALLRGEVKRIVLTRPAVEAGEKLGFLPGDLAEKVDPYLRPLYDAMGDMIPADKLERMLERRIIEVAPLAFMRGRTLQDAWVLLDEGQNTTVEQMKMFLTRLGDRSKMAINGDVTQIDLPPGRTSGLVHATRILEGVPGVEIVRLTTRDVVRHPLVARIIEAYASDSGVGRVERRRGIDEGGLSADHRPRGGRD